MLKIEAHNDLIDIKTDGTIDDLIGEAMCSIRSMYDFFREHNEDAERHSRHCFRSTQKTTERFSPMSTKARKWKASKMMSLFNKKNPPSCRKHEQRKCITHLHYSRNQKK